MGELARKPGAPTLAATPLELLTPRPGEGYSLMDKHFLPFVGGASGVVARYLMNLLQRKPYYAGIHNYLLMAAGGYYIFRVVRDIRAEARAEKDAVFKHYISLHPDDFPPYERKRYKDIFVPWNPVR